MSLEDETIELSLVYHGQRERVEELEQLVSDYDSYIKHVIPHTYATSDLIRALRQRKEALLGKEKPVPE